MVLSWCVCKQAFDDSFFGTISRIVVMQEEKWCQGYLVRLKNVELR